MNRACILGLVAALVLLGLCPAPALCAPVAPEAGDGAAAGAPLEEALALMEAYQSGYLQVVEAACFQVYYSTGIIASDLGNGNIDAGTALFALEQNSLLQSACVTTLAAVYELTPAADAGSRASLKRLWDIFIKEDALLRALIDSLGAPEPAAQQAVETARAEAERALNEYAADLAQ